jgi:thymidylate kinase
MTLATISAASLHTVVDLVQHLNDEGIRYCHWKSTHRLHQSLSGRTDLDILVDRNDAHRFREILAQHGFKLLISHPRQQYPGLEDYLGYEAETGNLTHLHVHYRLVLGEQYVKNYCLPLEQAFLDHTHFHSSGLKIPAPELEIIVLALRTLLKYRDRDVVHDIVGVGNVGGIPSGMLEEFDYLLAQTSPGAIKQALQQHVAFVSPDLILTFLSLLKSSPRAGWLLYRLRRRVRHELSAYQRHSRLRARTQYYRSMLGKQWPVDRLTRRLFPNSEKHKTPATGGLTIAFVGADGAGKSTIIRHVTKWLSWRLTVRTYYMGSARPSPVTRALKHSANVLEYAYIACRKVLGAHNPLTRQADRPHRYIDSLRFVAEGRDRYRRYRAGQRAMAQGAVVIYDRYPLSAIHLLGRTIDGPRIAAANNGRNDAVTHRLSQVEQALYARIRPPDHLVLLHVSPEVSQSRKPEHPRGLIEAKSQAIDQITRGELAIIDIDANQPLETVLLQIKTALWSLI